MSETPCNVCTQCGRQIPAPNTEIDAEKRGYQRGLREAEEIALSQADLAPSKEGFDELSDIAVEFAERRKAAE